MTTVSSVQTSPAAATPVSPGPPARRRFPWNTIGLYIGIIAIAVFCLAPFYWMVVSCL